MGSIGVGRVGAYPEKARERGQKAQDGGGQRNDRDPIEVQTHVGGRHVEVSDVGHDIDADLFARVQLVQGGLRQAPRKRPAEKRVGKPAHEGLGSVASEDVAGGVGVASVVAVDPGVGADARTGRFLSAPPCAVDEDLGAFEVRDGGFGPGPCKDVVAVVHARSGRAGDDAAVVPPGVEIGPVRPRGHGDRIRIVHGGHMDLPGRHGVARQVRADVQQRRDGRHGLREIPGRHRDVDLQGLCSRGERRKQNCEDKAHGTAPRMLNRLWLTNLGAESVLPGGRPDNGSMGHGPACRAVPPPGASRGASRGGVPRAASGPDPPATPPVAPHRAGCAGRLRQTAAQKPRGVGSVGAIFYWTRAERKACPHHDRRE